MNIQQKNGGDSAPAAAGAPISAPVPTEKPAEEKPVQSANTEAVRIKPPLVAERADIWFAISAMVLGYLYVELVYPFSPGFGVTAFAVLFYGAASLYLKKTGAVFTKSAFAIMGVAAVSAVSICLYQNYTLRFLNLLFLIGCTAYWAAAVCGTRMENRVGDYFPADMVAQFASVPFCNYFCGTAVLYRGAKGSRNWKGSFAVLGGLAAGLLLIMGIVPLLAAADSTFFRLVQNLSGTLQEELTRFLFRLFPAFLVGSYFFGLLYGNARKRSLHIKRANVDILREKCRRLPRVTVLTLLGMLCVLYLVFFCAQVSTLISALSGHPMDQTYSQYAREGFFELCKVAAINFAVAGGAMIFCERGGQEKPSRMVRGFLALLCAETLVLIATASSKMALYISRYGLTQLRVFTSWFMLLLAVLFCILLASQFLRVRVMKGMVTAFTVCFLALCCCNVDGLIVSTNIRLYETGASPALDVDMFYSMPAAAAPHAASLLERTQDAGLKADLLEMKNYPYFDDPFEKDWQALTVQELLAWNNWKK